MIVDLSALTPDLLSMAITRFRIPIVQWILLLSILGGMDSTLDGIFPVREAIVNLGFVSRLVFFFVGGSHSSVDSFDDHGRNGRAVYGSQSESDSDEALSLEENSRSR